MPFLVRLRPSAAYVWLLALAAALIGLGVTTDGAPGVAELAMGVLLLVGFGAPVVISTVFRVPLLAVDGDGVRLPLMGVRLAWDEVVDVRPARTPANRPVLLILPADPQATVRRMRPWVRAEGRTSLRHDGTPVVVPEQITDRTVPEMYAACVGARSPRR